MELTTNLQDFRITSILNLSDKQQEIRAVLYSQTTPIKVAEFIAKLTTIFNNNEVYFWSADTSNSSIILTYKKACNSSELIDIFKKLEEEFS